MSALAMLSDISEATGDGFRLKSDGTRVIEWMRDSFDVTNITVTANAMSVPTQDDFGVSVNINRVIRSQDLFTRMKPYGSGFGDSALTLSSATWTPPTGYTISGNWIIATQYESDTSEQIERSESYNISGYKGEISSEAANQLAKQAFEDLYRVINCTCDISFTVYGMETIINPGERIFLESVVEAVPPLSVTSFVNVSSVTLVFNDSGFSQDVECSIHTRALPRAIDSIAKKLSNLDRLVRSNQTVDSRSVRGRFVPSA
jgi:hypothetical protein